MAENEQYSEAIYDALENILHRVSTLEKTVKSIVEALNRKSKEDQEDLRGIEENLKKLSLKRRAPVILNFPEPLTEEEWQKLE